MAGREFLAGSPGIEPGILGRALEIRVLRSGAADALDRSTLDALRLERSLRFAIVRENAAKELRLLKAAVDTIQVGVVVKDPAGTILFVNPAMAKLSGYAVEELVSRHARLLGPRQIWRDMDPEELRNMTGWTRESVNIRKDGSPFAVRLRSGVVKDGSGNPIGIVTSAEDLLDGR